MQPWNNSPRNRKQLIFALAFSVSVGFMLVSSALYTNAVGIPPVQCYIYFTTSREPCVAFHILRLWRTKIVKIAYILVSGALLVSPFFNLCNCIRPTPIMRLMPRLHQRNLLRNTQLVAGNKHHVARSKLLVARNKLRVARNMLLQATSAGVNAALDSTVQRHIYWSLTLSLGLSHNSVYTVFQKGVRKLMAVKSTNLNRFSFSHRWKDN